MSKKVVMLRWLEMGVEEIALGVVWHDRQTNPIDRVMEMPEGKIHLEGTRRGWVGKVKLEENQIAMNLCLLEGMERKD